MTIHKLKGYGGFIMAVPILGCSGGKALMNKMGWQSSWFWKGVTCLKCLKERRRKTTGDQLC